VYLTGIIGFLLTMELTLFNGFFSKGFMLLLEEFLARGVKIIVGRREVGCSVFLGSLSFELPETETTFINF
jgi:hypothetical protein